MKTIEIRLGDIEVENRVRKNVGDLTELCNSIEAIGLLHPIVLTRGNKLVAGMRRVEAFEQLGRDKIPAVIAENLGVARELLIAERDENTCRLPFTPSEAVALGRQLEELEKPKAKERQSAAGRERGNGKVASGKLHEATSTRTGRTSEIVGEAVGMSQRTYEKAKAVAVAAESDPETFGPLVEEMDRTGKVHPAYDKLVEIKGEKRPVSEEPAKPAPSKKSVAVLRANDAIDCLMRIPANDPERKRGLQIVTDWIKHNK
jgi:ParB-like chromosome segregation protein Spo0J